MLTPTKIATLHIGDKLTVTTGYRWTGVVVAVTGNQVALKEAIEDCVKMWFDVRDERLATEERGGHE